MIDTAGRIGGSEITRLGMKEKEMDKIATFIHRISEGENSIDIRKEVITFKGNFMLVNYCN
jgi:glycine hydroxymethyltransferase